jgi:hypothetical protein
MKKKRNKSSILIIFMIPKRHTFCIQDSASFALPNMWSVHMCLCAREREKERERERKRDVIDPIFPLF